MTELIETAKSWFIDLGEKYGVNPLVFGIIYVGAIPFFTASIAWLVKNYRRKRPIVLPFLSSVFFFMSAYLYLIVEGNNMPWWIYGLVCAIVIYGVWTTWKRVCNSSNNLNK
jgi:hypothetical protein